MKSVTLVGVVMDALYAVSIGSRLLEGELALALKRHGVDAKLFDGRADGQLAEIARRLARMRTDTYLFIFPSTAGSLMAELATAVAKLRPMVRSIGLLTDDHYFDDPTNAFCSLAIWQGADQTAALLLDVPRLPAQSNPESCSVYLSGILPLEAVREAGLRLDQSEVVLRAEIGWVQAHADNIVEPVPLHANGLAGDELAAALDALHAEAVRFALHLPVGSMSDEVIDALERSPIQRVVLSGEGRVPERLHVSKTTIDSSAVMSVNDRSALYARNGILSFMTGIYVDGNALPAIYHLDVPITLPTDLRKETYRWSSPHMAAKSAAISEGPLALLEKELPSHRAPRREETGGWPAHVYGMGRSGDSVLLHVDGAPTATRRFDQVALHALNAYVPAADCDVIVTIRESEDVVELERRLACFHEQGVVRLSHPRRRITFENLCRYVSYGACSVGLMRRLSVREDRSIVPCLDTAPIANLDQPYDRIVVAARQHAQMEEVRRDCLSCPVREDCSRCSQLPSAWSGRYCSIRRAFPSMALFFELQGFLGRIAHALSAEANWFDVKVSAPGLPHQFYHGKAPVKGGRSRPLIISVGDEHFACRRGDRKVTRISAPLASVMEATWAGAMPEDTSSFLADRYSVSVALAEQSVFQAGAKLRQAGLVDA